MSCRLDETLLFRFHQHQVSRRSHQHFAGRHGGRDDLGIATGSVALQIASLGFHGSGDRRREAGFLPHFASGDHAYCWVTGGTLLEWSFTLTH